MATNLLDQKVSVSFHLSHGYTLHQTPSPGSSAEARTLYVQKGKPDLTILVELKPQGLDDEEILELLMEDQGSFR